MKKLFLIACALFASVAMALQVPTCEKVEAPWWIVRNGHTQVKCIDFNGGTNIITVLKSATVIKQHVGRNDATIEFDPNTLMWSKIEVKYSPLAEDYSYDIEKVAPGVYTDGKFYTDMTDAEKTSLWVAHTNKVIQAQVEHLKKKYADAKFDVSMDPEEYKAQLMEGRTDDDLTPDERMEIRKEYNEYKDEWLRINDPEKWEHPFGLLPGKGVQTEQQKKRSVGGEAARARARARKARVIKPL